MITKFLDTPWRLSNHVWRILQMPVMRLYFAWHGVHWGKQWRIFGRPIIQRHRFSQITMGDGIEMRSAYATNPLAPNHPVVVSTRKATARIQIGKNCGFTGVTLVADESIVIGDRVLVGANSTIVDTDFHPLYPHERVKDMLNGKHQPIMIEDDVFIGMNCLVLKGVTIGKGSIVGAGSVVVHNIPPGVIVAGNPAKIVRKL
ncbi:MAG: acyltransferase [Ardenticatenaceae bacterium]|nr:acyltransferase [Ardenticatenaceae bacterium]